MFRLMIFLIAVDIILEVFLGILTKLSGTSYDQLIKYIDDAVINRVDLGDDVIDNIALTKLLPSNVFEFLEQHSYIKAALKYVIELQLSRRFDPIVLLKKSQQDILDHDSN